MPYYIALSDYQDYVADNAVQVSDAIIDRAERDIDRVLGPYPIQANGRKMDITTLSTSELAALKNACCAQVQYRLLMGEAFFVQPQFDSVNGPEFNTSGKLPRIGPQAKDELAGQGLVRFTAQART